jgi:hypothetical protein
MPASAIGASFMTAGGALSGTCRSSRCQGKAMAAQGMIVETGAGTSSGEGGGWRT